MKKLTCTLLLAVTCVSMTQAQRGPETPDTVQELSARTTESLFTGFTASVNSSNKVLLQWDADSAAEGGFFIIERSPDGVNYETIDALRATGMRQHYQLTDQAPANGPDVYRIRYSGQDGRIVYSKTTQVSLSGEVDFKFYPNPVDKLFIVRTEHSIDLQVVDPTGGIRISRRLQPGIQIINVSALERGVYVLRVTDKESNRAVSQQLLKN